MFRKLTLVAALLATSAPLAHAQDGPRDREDRYEQSDRDDSDRPPMRERADRDDDDRSRDVRHGDRWARSDYDDDDREDRDDDRKDRKPPREARGPHHGPGGHRGPPPPRTGFMIEMGPGQSLHVQCGDESLSDCVEAAQPILDRFAQSGSVAGDRIPPPPEALVNEGAPTPPAPAN